MMLRWPVLRKADIAYFLQAPTEAVDAWVADSVFPQPAEVQDGEKVWTQFQFRKWIEANRNEIRNLLDARRDSGRNVSMMLDFLTQEGKAFEGCPGLTAQ